MAERTASHAPLPKKIATFDGGLGSISRVSLGLSYVAAGTNPRRLVEFEAKARKQTRRQSPQSIPMAGTAAESIKKSAIILIIWENSTPHLVERLDCSSEYTTPLKQRGRSDGQTGVLHGGSRSPFFSKKVQNRL